MRTRLLPAAALLATTVLAAMLIASPNVAATAGVPATSVDQRDYLSDAGAADNECALAATARVGNWVCVGDAPHDGANATQRGVTSSTTTGGFCTAQGCWDVYSGVSSDFYTEGTFGYGGQTLGTVWLSYDVTLNGGQSVSQPVSFEASTSISSLEIEGDRLYYSSAYPGGHPVSPSVWSYTMKYSIPSDTTVYWTPNGYKAFEDTVQHGSVVHEWVWTKSDYPGNWYLYAKSVKFDMTSSSYRFGSPSYLGDSPVGAGWHSS